MQFPVNDGTQFVMNYEVIPGILPETTLFIHGNCASNHWWEPAMAIWKQKAQGQNLKGSAILAEFRGCGQSSTPLNPEKEVRMATLVNDFIALTRSLNEGPINIVGHSAGGLIAAMMMAQESSLFKKGFLLDPVGAAGVQFDVSMIAAFEQMKTDRELTAAVIGATIYQNDPQNAFFRDVLVEDAFHAVKSVGHLVIKALDRLDVRSDMAKVHNKVMVVHGEHDLLLPMADSQALAKLMPYATYMTIPGQGHCTNVEAPEKFVKLVSDFLF